MNHSLMTQRKKPHQSDRVAAKQSRPADDAFDIWLNRGLHALFDDVAKEPIPDELLRLIEEDRRK